MTKMQTPEKTKAGNHVKQQELQIRMQKGCSHLQDSLTVSYKNKHTNYRAVQQSVIFGGLTK